MSEPLRFGLIGLGRFGAHYARLLQEMEGVSFYAVAARDEKSFASAGVPPTIKRFSDGLALIHDPLVDCVIIATPATTHAELARAALQAGKHVLVEKPMTATLAEATLIAGLAASTDRTFMVGHQYLYNDYIRELKRQFSVGVFGKIAYVFAEHFYPGPIRNDIGCFWETATHELAIVDFLFSRPRLLNAQVKMIDIAERGYDDFTQASLLFENDLSVSIATSWFAPQKVRRMMIAGEKGMAVFDDAEPDHKLKLVLRPYPSDIGKPEFSPEFFSISEDEMVMPNVTPREPLRNQLEHFIACIASRALPLTDITHGMWVTELLSAVYAEGKKGVAS